MRAGEFPDGARVLRAKIDMAAPNINLRDPVLYRILHAEHPRTGDAWCVYPTYDFAHGQSDAIEGITHSICTLEFEAHRPLYDWLIENLPVPSVPHQYEFARLNLTHTVLSKRVLLRLVNEGIVRGWDDPRMPTMSGLRRRGFPAEGIREFATMVGVAKADNTAEVEMLEHCVRDVLNRAAPRRFAVLDPLRIVIENYPERQTEEMEVPNNPEDPAAGHAQGDLLPRALDRARRLHGGAGAQVLPPGPRTRGAAALGLLRHLRRGRQGRRGPGRRVALHLRPGDARRRRSRRPPPQGHPALALGRARRCPPRSGSTTTSSSSPYPGAGGRDIFEDVSAESETVLRGSFVEPALAEAPVGETVQFERLGYFCPDPDSAPDAPVFNRTLTLRDTWAKLQKQGRQDRA